MCWMCRLIKHFIPFFLLLQMWWIFFTFSDLLTSWAVNRTSLRMNSYSMSRFTDFEISLRGRGGGGGGGRGLWCRFSLLSTHKSLMIPSSTFYQKILSRMGITEDELFVCGCWSHLCTEGARVLPPKKSLSKSLKKTRNENNKPPKKTKEIKDEKTKWRRRKRGAKKSPPSGGIGVGLGSCNHSFLNAVEVKIAGKFRCQGEKKHSSQSHH